MDFEINFSLWNMDFNKIYLPLSNHHYYRMIGYTRGKHRQIIITKEMFDTAYSFYLIKLKEKSTHNKNCVTSNLN